MVKRGDKPVSQLCHRFEPLPQVLKNVRYQRASRSKMRKCARPSQVPSANSARGGRLIVRPSGTEPVIRVMGEGDDRNLVEISRR
mgnify:CR=1 FL=1